MRCIIFCLPLLAGCAAMSKAPSLPTDLTIARDQLEIYCDFHLPTRHRLVEELVALRADVAGAVGVPVSDEPIHVYLFQDTETYHGYMRQHFPELPNRRAFFVETDTRLVVYAQWGDRVAEDLRHEVTHGYLHAVIPNLPLWLDEGLAEYFEVPRGWNGLHIAHLQLLADLDRQQAWQPNLQRLERLATVGELRQEDYAEAWLWTHFLLESSRPRRVLLQHYLSVLRDKAQAPPLAAAMLSAEPEVADAVRAHLRSLAKEYASARD